MWKYSPKDFAVTNKARGLSLYNSFAGPTNIRKEEFLAKKRAFEREGLDGRGLSNERDVSDSSKVVRETDSKICHDESLPKNPRVENGAEIGVADEAVNRKNLVKKKLSSKSAIKKSSNRDGNLPSNERKMFDGKSFKDSCRKLLEKVKVIIFNFFQFL